MCQVLFVISVLSLLYWYNISCQAILENLECQSRSMRQSGQPQVGTNLRSRKHDQMCHIQGPSNWNKVFNGILFRNFKTWSCIWFHDTSEIPHQFFNVFADIASEDNDWVRSPLDIFWFIPVLFWLIFLKVRMKFSYTETTL